MHQGDGFAGRTYDARHCLRIGWFCLLGLFRHVRPVAHGRLRRARLLDHVRAHAHLRRILPRRRLREGLARRWGRLFRDWRSMISIAAFSIFGIALCQVSYFSVIHHTSAGVGTTIEQLGLVLIMLWTCLRKRRLPNRARGAWARVRHGGARPDRHAGRSFPIGVVAAGMLLGHGVGRRVGLVHADAGEGACQSGAR